MGVLVSSAKDPQDRRIKSWQQLLDRQGKKLLSTHLEQAGEREGMIHYRNTSKEQLLSSQRRIQRMMFSHPEEEMPGIKQNCAAIKIYSKLSHLIFPLGENKI